MKKVKKYRKRPIPVEAIQYRDDTIEDIFEFTDGKAFADVHEFEDGRVTVSTEVLRIITLEGILYAMKGGYVAKGIDGEIYPIKQDIFERTYEEIT